MIFLATPLPGCWLIDLDPARDERGMFARSFCRREFEVRGLNANTEQCAVSFNSKRGTVRGMHWQDPPHEQAKVIRCTRGSIHDVILDLRPHSPAYLQWFAAELSADNRRMMYAAEGVAHGFLTLADDSEVFYQMSAAHEPACERGARWNDPVLNIQWPFPPVVLSARDQTHPLFELLETRK